MKRLLRRGVAFPSYLYTCLRAIMLIVFMMSSILVYSGDVEVLFVTNKVIAVFYDDGYLENEKDMRYSDLHTWPLDLNQIQDGSNYLLSSSEDLNYSDPRGPLGEVGRKSIGMILHLFTNPRR